MSADVIRIEFDRALRTMIARAQMFEHGTEHVEVIFGWALRTEFYHASSHVSVTEFFNQSVASHKASVQILDLLHAFVSEFTFGLLLHDHDLPTRLASQLAEAIGILVPINGHGVLPEHVTDLLVRSDEAVTIFHDNMWFYALTLIRYLGGALMTEDAPPLREERRR